MRERRCRRRNSTEDATDSGPTADSFPGDKFDEQQSGKITGRAGLTLNLASVKVNGRLVDVNTRTVSRESSSRGKRTAEVAGGTAAVGAIIGAIVGGGKGAAGTGAEVVTSGQRVKIPSETRLTFVLDTPVRF